MKNIMVNNKAIKSFFRKSIKEGYAVEAKSLFQNELFFSKVVSEIQSFYEKEMEPKLEKFLEKYPEYEFLFTNGYRNTAYRMRKNFYVWLDQNKDGSQGYLLVDSKTGKIISNNVDKDGRLDINNIETLPSDFCDYEDIKRVMLNHQIDFELGLIIIQIAYKNILQKDLSTATIMNNDIIRYYEDLSKYNDTNKQFEQINTKTNFINDDNLVLHIINRG